MGGTQARLLEVNAPRDEISRSLRAHAPRQDRNEG